MSTPENMELGAFVIYGIYHGINRYLQNVTISCDHFSLPVLPNATATVKHLLVF